MAQVSLPYTLTAGTPENVNNLMSNLNALVAGVNTIDTAQIAAGGVTTAKIADANVTTAKIADASVTPAKLASGVLLSGSANASSDLATTTSFQDIPGASVTFTPAIAGYVIVNAVVDIAPATGSNQGIAQLVLDGSAQSGTIVAEFQSGPARATVAQTYRLSLTAASHTIKLQAKNTGYGATVYQTHTRLTYIFIGS